MIQGDWHADRFFGHIAAMEATQPEVSGRSGKSRRPTWFSEQHKTSDQFKLHDGLRGLSSETLRTPVENMNNTFVEFMDPTQQRRGLSVQLGDLAVAFCTWILH